MKPRFLKPLHFCSAKIIPLVFDNSLSYYEQLCAFSAKLNCIIDYVNSMSLGLTEFYEMINTELDNYVTMTEFNEFKAYIIDLINHIVPGAGVGETIVPGTQYTFDDVTYTAGDGCEIFNSYTGEGRNQAAGTTSTARGSFCSALGTHSTAAGLGCAATGADSISIGNACKSTGNYSVSVGYYSNASANGAIATGQRSEAAGINSAAIGHAYAAGTHSFAEGFSEKDEETPANSTGALGDYSHSEGYNSIASGDYAHAEGAGKAAGAYSHCEGWNNDASYGAIGDYSHVEGYGNLCVAEKSHVEGGTNQIVTPSCRYSHAEGIGNIISDSETAHIEGDTNKILVGSNRAHVEGYNNTITGDIVIQNSGSWEAHAEGRDNRIEHSYRAHVEGESNNIYKSNSAHAEGDTNVIYKNCTASHAEGMNNVIGDALGTNAAAAHVQGDSNTATGNQSSATGYHTTASGAQSTTMGEGTIASGANSLAIGKYNVDSGTGYSFIIGDGTDTDNRSNVMAVDSTNHIVEFPADLQFKLGNGSPFTPGSGGGAPAVITGSITAQTGYKFDESGLESSVTQQGNICVCNIQVYPQNQYNVPATYQYTHIGDISGIALPTKKIFMPAVIVTSTATAGETQAAIVIDTTGKIEIFTIAGTAWTIAAQTGIFATITYTV